MILRILALILTLGYLAYSIFFLYTAGFKDPRQAMWVGLIGFVVMAVAIMLRGLARRRK